jgi:hypothetical protein
VFFHYLSDFNLADFDTEFRRFSDFEDFVGRREGLQQWWGSIVLPKFAVLFKRVLCPVFLTNLEGKVGKVDKVDKVGRVGKVGKVGKEGRLRE